jgi:predicted RNA-binding protein YlxR (DUF448 family)
MIMKSVPIRQCIACRKKTEKKTLFRIVRTSENHIHFDPNQTMNGRGVYLCKNAACIQKAQTKDLIGHSFHRTVPDALYVQIAEAFQPTEKTSIETLIGFASRSRKLIKGLTGVTEAARKKKIHLLILDPEAGATTRKRIETLHNKWNIPLVEYTGKKSLSDIVGKDRCRCVGVTDTQFARTILKMKQEHNK